MGVGDKWACTEEVRVGWEGSTSRLSSVTPEVVVGENGLVVGATFKLSSSVVAV